MTETKRAQAASQSPGGRDLAYFQDFLKAVSVTCWIRGRVKFISSIDLKPVSGNPFASMIVGLAVDAHRFARAFGGIGMVEVRRGL